MRPSPTRTPVDPTPDLPSPPGAAARWRPALWRRLLQRRPVYWAVAAALVVATVATVERLTAAAEAARARWGATTEVLVVREHVAAGDPVAPRVAPVALPLALVPALAVAAGDGLPAGAVATTDLVAGEILVGSRVSGDGDAGLVPAGHLAVGIPATAGIPPLRVGSRVQVVTLSDPLTGTTPASVPGRVVAADEDRVTVAVPAEDATVVAAALATGTVVLALAP